MLHRQQEDNCCGMTKILLAVCCFFIAGCGSREKQETAFSYDTSATTAQVTNTNIDTTPVPDQPIINHDSLPAETIGQMILDGKLIPSDNEYTFRMMDSLQTVHGSKRKFYFGVFNKIMDRADGALGEAVGDYALTYVEQNPKLFIGFISAYPSERFETWASHIGIELFLSSNDSKSSYDKFSQSFITNCKNCNTATINKLKRFNKLVWQTMKENEKAAN